MALQWSWMFWGVAFTPMSGTNLPMSSRMSCAMCRCSTGFSAQTLSFLPGPAARAMASMRSSPARPVSRRKSRQGNHALYQLS